MLCGTIRTFIPLHVPDAAYICHKRKNAQDYDWNIDEKDRENTIHFSLFYIFLHNLRRIEVFYYTNTEEVKTLTWLKKTFKITLSNTFIRVNILKENLTISCVYIHHK